MYADGSKNETRTGAAATIGNRTESASLPKCSSIFTTETYAKHLTLNTKSATKGKNFTIFTDLRSCIQAIQNQIQTNSKIQKLNQTIANLQK